MAYEPPCDLGSVMHELYLLSFPGVLVVGGDGSIVTMVVDWALMWGVVVVGSMRRP